MFLQQISRTRIFLAQNLNDIKFGNRFRYFRPSKSIQYVPFCDDFGPLNMGSTCLFIQELEAELDKFPEADFIYEAEKGKRALSNAVFLLGAFMIIKLDMVPLEVQAKFSWLERSKIESFRDATHQPKDFLLHLEDCWGGLFRGKQLGWVMLPDKSSSYLWGKIDQDEYNHYDSLANGSITEVIPGKFLAMPGPIELPDGQDYVDLFCGRRIFSPAFFADILHDFEIKAVVRLNSPRYPAEAFTDLGFEHHHLAFPDCTCPPPAVIASFLHVAESIPGAIAVHCKAGLGRTGTLIAIYMIKHFGFTAREAMGWLRIMRPGSVIGEQQQFLCRFEAALRRHQQRQSAMNLAPLRDQPSWISIEEFIQVDSAIEGRAATAAEAAQQVTDGLGQRSRAMAASAAARPAEMVEELAADQ